MALMGGEITWLGVTVRDFILNVVTFGFSSLRDSLYREIAIGIYDRASGFLLGIVGGVLAVFTVAAFAIAFGILRGKKRQTAASDPTPPPGGRKGRPPVWVETTFALFIFAFMLTAFGTVVRAAYADYASALSAQYLQIVAPYVDDLKMKEWRSRMAQAVTANDYLTVIEEIYATGERKGAVFPDVNWF
jgi:hypothetical protein